MNKQANDKGFVIASIRMTKEQRETMTEIAYEHGMPSRDIFGLAVNEFIERRKKDNGVITVTRKKLMIKKELKKNEQLENLITKAKSLNREVCEMLE